MIRNEERICDACMETIPRGTAYRAGWTIPQAIAKWQRANTARAPTFTPEPDGTIRLEVCERCMAELPGLAEVTEERVDAVH